MQSDGVDVDIPSASEIAEELWDQFEDEVRDGLDEIIESGIELVFGSLQTEITDWLSGLFDLFFGPMVGTPAPVGPTSAAPVDIAFQEAQGWWSPLISNVYFEAIVPLALGVQFIAWAAVGIRYKAFNPVVRKKLGRRLLIAFLTLFFWLPIASLATQFFDALGRQIVLTGIDGDTAEAVANLIGITTFLQDLAFGAFAIFILLAAYVYLKALFVFVARWIMVVLLTIAMPLVASFWALEVWPFNRFAGLSKQIAGAYPGLLAAGLPPAILLRIGIEAGGEASSVSFGLGSSLAFAISLIIVYLAAKSQKEMIRRSSRVATRVSEQVLAGAKKPVKIGGAAAAVGASAGLGAAYGPAAAMKAGGAINTAANVAKGRPGRAARSVQMLHRNLANAKNASTSSSSNSSSSTSATPSTGSIPSLSSPSGPHTTATSVPDPADKPGSNSSPSALPSSSATPSTGSIPSSSSPSGSQSAATNGSGPVEEPTTLGPESRPTAPDPNRSSQDRDTTVDANRDGRPTAVDTQPRQRDTQTAAEEAETVTYWDAVEGENDHGDTEVYTTEEQWSDSSGEGSLGSTTTNSLEDIFEEEDDDDESVAAAPVASSDGDPPDEAGAGQVDPSFEDVFAGGDDPLGPKYYRDRSDTDGS